MTEQKAAVCTACGSTPEGWRNIHPTLDPKIAFIYCKTCRKTTAHRLP